MSQHLSPKLSFNNEIEHSIAKAYEYFSTQLNDQNERPRLFGKQIFYESYEMVENKIVGFWHLISTKLINLSLLPCKGDIVYKRCDRNCIKLTRLIEIKNNKETRAVCLFRASHLPWIKDVIKLANERCEFVLCWQITDANNRKKLYVRYKKECFDYVLILSDERNMYRLLTAYPVFFEREKKKFDKGYIDHKWVFNP